MSEPRGAALPLAAWCLATSTIYLEACGFRGSVATTHVVFQALVAIGCGLATDRVLRRTGSLHAGAGLAPWGAFALQFASSFALARAVGQRWWFEREPDAFGRAASAAVAFVLVCGAGGGLWALLAMRIVRAAQGGGELPSGSPARAAGAGAWRAAAVQSALLLMLPRMMDWSSREGPMTVAAAAAVVAAVAGLVVDVASVARLWGRTLRRERTTRRVPRKVAGYREGPEVEVEQEGRLTLGPVPERQRAFLREELRLDTIALLVTLGALLEPAVARSSMGD